MLQETVTSKIDFIKAASMRQVNRMLQNLEKSVSVYGSVKKESIGCPGRNPVIEPIPAARGIQPCGAILSVSNGDEVLP